ncbi:putative Tumor protein D54 [Daphnia magna]|uniref:Putative Tumor protein D54 n=1 Tax=Daphnia magna TaxID=35525 RepID=A0A164RLI1_9CRUS|nr:putative Tumor protein D54 [Daphnia magna]
MNNSASNSNKFQDEPKTPDVSDGMGEFPMSQSFMNLSIEEQEIKKEEWRKELAEVEYEIQTMRQVLTSKLRKSSELKRKLGITAWGEFSNDISQGLRNVKETSTFQTIEEKVEEVSKAISSAPFFFARKCSMLRTKHLARYEPAENREREWLRAQFCKIALRVAIDRRRHWASFHRNPFVKERKRPKRGKTGRSKKELVSLLSVPVCLSLSASKCLVSSRLFDLN